MAIPDWVSEIPSYIFGAGFLGVVVAALRFLRDYRIRELQDQLTRLSMRIEVLESDWNLRHLVLKESFSAEKSRSEHVRKDLEVVRRNLSDAVLYFEGQHDDMANTVLENVERPIRQLLSSVAGAPGAPPELLRELRSFYDTLREMEMAGALEQYGARLMLPIGKAIDAADVWTRRLYDEERSLLMEIRVTKDSP